MEKKRRQNLKRADVCLCVRFAIHIQTHRHLLVCDSKMLCLDWPHHTNTDSPILCTLAVHLNRAKFRCCMQFTKTIRIHEAIRLSHSLAVDWHHQFVGCIDVYKSCLFVYSIDMIFSKLVHIPLSFISWISHCTAENHKHTANVTSSLSFHLLIQRDSFL